MSPSPGASPGRRFVEILDESSRPPLSGSSGSPPASPEVKTAAGSAQVDSASPLWRKLTEDVLQAENRIDALIAAARRGKTFSAPELLAIQAEVFRYSQTVEVISRATDKLVGAIKQTLSTQV
jgi:hypothetical protein